MLRARCVFCKGFGSFFIYVKFIQIQGISDRTVQAEIQRLYMQKEVEKEEYHFATGSFVIEKNWFYTLDT